MSVANLTARGSASKVDYAIVIEGWPEIWVTNPRITLSSVTAGRVVRRGLLHEGIEIEERTVPSEGRIEGGEIRFRVVSTNDADEATASFCNYPTDPVAQLEGALGKTTTTLDIVGSTTLADGYYYLGTETIEVSTFPTIVRARHGSFAQDHPVTTLENGASPYWIYDRPPSLEGRRVSLYIWTDDDDVTQFTQVIWRGYIQAPAKLGSDGITWSVYASHIAAVMSQTLAPSSFRTRIVGLYHSYQCAVEMTFQYDLNGLAKRSVTGFHATPQDLVPDVQTELDAIMSDLSATAHTLTFHYDDDRGLYFLRLTTDAAPPTNFPGFVGSPLIGFAHAFNWFNEDTEEAVHNTNLAGNTTYVRYLDEMNPTFLGGPGDNELFGEPPEQPPFPAAYLGGHLFSSVTNTFGYLTFRDSSASSTAPANRFYVSDDLSILDGIGSVVFVDTIYDRGFDITAASSDSNGYYVEVNFSRNAIGGDYITGDTGLSAVNNYATGNVIDFIDALENNGYLANSGLVPHIAKNDFSPASQIIPDSVAEQYPRTYQVAADVTIEDCLAAEALFYGVMWSTNSTGSMYLRPLPLLSAGVVAAYDIDTTQIVTPYGDGGRWPEVHVQRDGSVNTVVVQDDYRYQSDEWVGDRFVIKHLPSIAASKNKGRSTVEIKPYSRNASHPLDAKDARRVAGQLLRLMARPYMTITVEATWHLFSARLGDIVTLTCPQAPNGRGGRGLNSKRCFVVERAWNMDPGAGGAPGRLVLWALLDDVAGYAPSAFITSKVDNGGNNWTLTALSTNSRNVAISQQGDGKVLDHFVVGDEIRVSEVNAASGDTQTGSVASVDVDNDTITVDFDGVFANTGTNYHLEFNNAATSPSSNQQRYAYVADDDLTLADGTAVRRLA